MSELEKMVPDEKTQGQVISELVHLWTKSGSGEKIRDSVHKWTKSKYRPKD